MQILLHRNFLKDYARLPKKSRNKFKERRNLFIVNPFDPLLSNHSVDAAYPGWRSINITGDYRALFAVEAPNTVVFMRIGTHPELY